MPYGTVIVVWYNYAHRAGDVGKATFFSMTPRETNDFRRKDERREKLFVLASAFFVRESSDSPWNVFYGNDYCVPNILYNRDKQKLCNCYKLNFYVFTIHINFGRLRNPFLTKHKFLSDYFTFLLIFFYSRYWDFSLRISRRAI